MDGLMDGAEEKKIPYDVKCVAHVAYPFAVADDTLDFTPEELYDREEWDDLSLEEQKAELRAVAENFYYEKVNYRVTVNGEGLG
jgi:hypothetical protein